MKKTFFLVTGILALGAGVVLLLRTGDYSKPPAPDPTVAAPAAASDPAPAQRAATARVPAYQRAAEVRHLAPTLPPEQFFGKARTAYQIVAEIPQTIAQLPCYCHCDESFGHKSLHTCFLDDHAAHCAVCVDEALLAYKLEKQDKLTPEQVRAVIVQKYSDTHSDH